MNINRDFIDIEIFGKQTDVISEFSVSTVLLLINCYRLSCMNYIINGLK